MSKNLLHGTYKSVALINKIQLCKEKVIKKKYHGANQLIGPWFVLQVAEKQSDQILGHRKKWVKMKDGVFLLSL